MKLPRVLAISSLDEHKGARDLPHSLASSFAEWLERIASCGSITVQIREKQSSDRQIFRWALEARKRLPSSCPVLVNGRADIAFAAGAEGVHLPAHGVPTAPLRRRFGSSFVIGRSTHTLDEVREASLDGADFVTFGPVFATPSKERYGPPVGVEELAEAAKLPIAVFALGGIDADRVEAVAAAGAWGVGGIRIFNQSTGTALMSKTAARAWSHRRPSI